MKVHLTLADFIFGCWHRHLSFPITWKGGRRRPDAAFPNGTYVVCLDCGRKFPYDWGEMRIIDSTTEPALTQRVLEAGAHRH